MFCRFKNIERIKKCPQKEFSRISILVQPIGCKWQLIILIVEFVIVKCCFYLRKWFTGSSATHYSFFSWSQTLDVRRYLNSWNGWENKVNFYSDYLAFNGQLVLRLIYFIYLFYQLNLGGGGSCTTTTTQSLVYRHLQYAVQFVLRISKRISTKMKIQRRATKLIPFIRNNLHKDRFMNFELFLL